MLGGVDSELKSSDGDVNVNDDENTIKEESETIYVEKIDNDPKNYTPKQVDEIQRQLLVEEFETSNVRDSSSSKPIKFLPIVNSPFPQRLKKREEDAMF